MTLHITFHIKQKGLRAWNVSFSWTEAGFDQKWDYSWNFSDFTGGGLGPARGGPYLSILNSNDFSESDITSFAGMLETDDHTVTFEKIEEQNAVELIVHDEIIFKCKIQQLEFGKKKDTEACKSTLILSKNSKKSILL